MNIEPEEVCFYPDKTREKLKEMFFGQNEIEKQIIDEIKILLTTAYKLQFSKQKVINRSNKVGIQLIMYMYRLEYCS